MKEVQFTETRVTRGLYITDVAYVGYFGTGIERGGSKVRAMDGLIICKLSGANPGKVKVTKLTGRNAGIYSVVGVGNAVGKRRVYLLGTAVLVSEGNFTTLDNLFAARG